MNALPSRLLAVTDRHQARAPLLEVVDTLLGTGLRWLWLRDRDLPPGERLALAEVLSDMTRVAGATLTIGADVDLAERVETGGVHVRAVSELGFARTRLGPHRIVGVSAHSLAECRAAYDGGADYATLSPIFASPSKPGYGPALGVGALTEAASIGLPILALGGVGRLNAQACLDAGAAGIAVMGVAMRPEGGALAAIMEVTRRS